MMKVGARFGNYVVDRVLASEPDCWRGLSRDLFVDQNVLLTLVPLPQAARNPSLEHQLEEFLRLEHPGLAALFDGGFEGDFFYFISDDPYQHPLEQRLSSGLTGEEVVRILDRSVDLLDYLRRLALPVAVPELKHFYCSADGYVTVAACGVAAQLIKAGGSTEPLCDEQLLAGLTALGGALLDAYDLSCSDPGREAAMDMIAESLGLIEGVAVSELAEFKKLTARLMPESAPENPANVSGADLVTIEDPGTIDLRQRSLLLPHIRHLLEQQHHLQQRSATLLVEKGQIEARLVSALNKVDELSRRLQQSERQVTDLLVRKPYPAYAAAVLMGIFTFGLGWMMPQISTEPLMAQSSGDLSVAIETTAAEPTTALIDEGDALEAAAPPALHVPDSGSWRPVGGELDDEEATASADGSAVNSEDLSVPVELGAAVAGLVLDWAQSWSDQRVDDYLDYYSDDFRPERPISHTQWRQERRLWILGASSIQVAISQIHIDRSANRRLRASFHQEYSSDRYRDRVAKTLELVEDSSGWKIISERALPLP